MYVKILQKLLKILQINSLQLLKIISFILLFSFLAFAHGDEDHDEENASVPVAQSGKLNSKLAKTSQVEILVKYPTPTPGLQTQLRIFVTDINTNSPVENAKLSLSFSLINSTSKQTNYDYFGVVYAEAKEFQVEAVPSNIAGVYQIPVTFPKSGIYQLKLKLTANNLDASATILGLVVDEEIIKLKQESNNFWLLIGLATLFLTLVISGFWYRNRSKLL